MSNLLPYLFLLACPLMTVFMMRGMNHAASGHGGMGSVNDTTNPAHRWDARDDRLAELEREVTRGEGLSGDVELLVHAGCLSKAMNVCREPVGDGEDQRRT
ncbi:MAG: DUF2933 domain-containing protein [Actinomycetales bacterium]|nr:DUF2933 domain-containing protein [Actinomycetales bacterium]